MSGGGLAATCEGGLQFAEVAIAHGNDTLHAEASALVSQGTLLPRVTFVGLFVQQGGAAVPAYQLILEDVVVTRSSLNGLDPTSGPSYQLVLAFSRLTLSYRSQDAAGRLSAPWTYTWTRGGAPVTSAPVHALAFATIQPRPTALPITTLLSEVREPVSWVGGQPTRGAPEVGSHEVVAPVDASLLDTLVYCERGSVIPSVAVTINLQPSGGQPPAPCFRLDLGDASVATLALVPDGSPSIFLGLRPRTLQWTAFRYNADGTTSGTTSPTWNIATNPRL
jgi:hypothetical protein